MYTCGSQFFKNLDHKLPRLGAGDGNLISAEKFNDKKNLSLLRQLDEVCPEADGLLVT